MKRLITIITTLCLFGVEIFAQSSVEDISKSSWTISIVEAHRLGEDSKWSNPGIEIKYNLSISDRFNAQLRGGFINWGQSDTRAFPLMMGISAETIYFDRYSINLYFISGPSLLIGNDYASIFATAETGIEMASNKRGLSLFIGYGKNMLFHPDHSEYIKGGVGFQF